MLLITCQCFTCSAVGLASASFLRQSSTNEQNSGEKLCLDGDGDGSSKIFGKNHSAIQIKKMVNQLNIILLIIKTT